MTYAVIPAKGFDGAKQRLASFLQPEERRALMRAMLTNTLIACTQARSVSGVGVVTSDREVAEMVTTLGAEVLWEPEAQGHSQAVAVGVEVCRQRGIAAILTLPGDLPLLTTADVQAILRPSVPAVPVLLVPNHDALGTNAVVLSPPDCLPLAFGHDSFQRHLHLAAARHLAVEIRRLPRVALDIDEPSDLAVLMAQQATCQSAQVLAALGVLDRLAQAFPPAHR